MLPMRELFVSLAVLFGLLTGLASGQDDGSDQTIELCADFTLFPDNHKSPDRFTYSAFRFKRLGGTTWFVNETGSERGLQFPEQGMEVTLPAAFSQVTLRLGTFNGDVLIEAMNADGKVILNRPVTATNDYGDLRIQAPADERIAALRLTKGGNEGTLPRICVQLAVCQ